MQHRSTVSYPLVAVLALAACRRAESSTPPAAPNAAAVAAQPAMPAPAVVPAAAVAPAAPAVDPRWPTWMPPVPGIRVRMGSRDFVEGGADRNVLLVLVESRRACEQAGYTLSQTTIRRTQWEQRFIFTATRAAELIRVELMGQPSRPTYTSFTASNGDFARTLMRQRNR